MKKTAKCLCGSLSIEVEGAPKLSMACNCTNCQRRTGSVFGSMTYYSDEQVGEIKGEYKNHSFKVESGNTNKTYFCPNCGSTVFFKTGMFQGQTGIAAGCFNDPDTPEPTINVWTQSKYKWMELPKHCLAMEQQIPSRN